MQKKLEKLENKINSLLTVIGGFLIKLILKMIPPKYIEYVQNKIALTKTNYKNWKELKKQQAIDLLIKLKDNLIKFKDLVLLTVDKIQKFPLKEKILSYILPIRDYLLKTPLKTHVKKIEAKIVSAGSKVSVFVNKTGKQQLAIAFCALLMIGLGVSSMYNTSKEIYHNEFQTRAPASVQEYDDKPDYFMYKRKTATILKVAVPIFREDVNEIRRITIDFTVRTSTRFAKRYLEFHDQKLKDYFFTTVEPVIASFPIEDEGKRVLKEKIHFEVNNFLIREKVEGHVEEVHLTYSQAY